MYRKAIALILAAVLLFALPTFWGSAEAAVTTGMVTASRLRLRTSPNYSASVIGTIPAGNRVFVLKDEGGWFKVACGSTVGYVDAQYLRVEPDEPLYAVDLIDGELIYAQDPEPEVFGIIRMSKAASPAKPSIPTTEGYEYAATGDSLRDSIVADALELLGVPYVYGGTTPSGFDCSGFTGYVFAENGIDLPRTASQQYDGGTDVSAEELRPGDLIFTGSNGRINHVGIYIGNGDFIHSPYAGKTVSIVSLNSSWYSSHFIAAARVLSD